MSNNELTKCPKCKALLDTQDDSDHLDWHERLVNLLHTLDMTKTSSSPVLGTTSTFNV